MSKTAPPVLTPEEIVAQALNEQGFLLHHRVLAEIQAATLTDQWGDAWLVEAFEVPVSLPNHDETRIDIVLKHKRENLPWWVVVECKRASPGYKRWVFFAQNKIGRGPSPEHYHIEHANMVGTWHQDGKTAPPMSHGLTVKGASPKCPVYDFGIEARLNGISHQKRVSATESIEDALQQVTLGQAGLALKLRAAHELIFNLLPIVITTADLMTAEFDVDKVSLSLGQVESKDLTLKQRKWLAVNYRANDVICHFSGFTNINKMTVAEHVRARQVRTVFVVQSKHVIDFLSWAEGFFPSNS